MTNQQQQPQQQQSHEVKCVAVGDGEVGKTCMLMAYTTNTFPSGYTPTVFDEWSAKVVVDDKQFDMRLCDTAGQEAYDRLRPLSYRGTSIFLLCFSIANPTSLENITDKWYPEVMHYAPTASVILVGTKADLREADTSQASGTNGNGQVNRQRGKMVAKEIKAVKYLECSALTRDGLKEVFDEAVRVSVGTHKKKSCSIL